ncbi:MAG TPA: glycosyltransferase family 2 protein, partial [Saprospiraceae bacterium]|nr:glycosyltransferase family 2 protein [Saprospiraceae bacterium]
GSQEMVIEKFPTVKLIANTGNEGFSKANNQAIVKSTGDFILLLNPDTVLSEDTLIKCIDKMEEDVQIGAIGVRMIDGGGNFLPESKRGFPSPFVAFCKTSGLYKIFPKSALFNKYYMGNLDQSENHEIEILSGAFMFIRKGALDKAGLLDESFFMYGEDIDLSYRLTKAGFKNYYLADTTIIHYKGESTKKGSLNYVKTFYQAMIIFARKHFTDSSARWYIQFIHVAIFFRGFFTLLSQKIKRFYLPVLDAGLLYAGLILCKWFWAWYKFNNIDYYPVQFNLFNAPIYMLLWVFSNYVNGAYLKIDNYIKLWRGLLFGTLIIAALYGFLELGYRNSRAIIILGLLWGLVALTKLRVLLISLKYGRFQTTIPEISNIIIVGEPAESERLQLLIKQTASNKNILGYVSHDQLKSDQDCLGNIQHLTEIATMYKADEVIFCAKDISSSEIMKWMTNLGSRIQYKILPEEGSFVIGSQSKENLGELYTFDIHMNISLNSSLQKKRFLDLTLAILFILFSPIILLFKKGVKKLFTSALWVIDGECSWVGYYKPDKYAVHLPPIRRGILNPLDEFQMGTNDLKIIERLNFIYAKEYTLEKDLRIIWKGRSKLFR